MTPPLNRTLLTLLALVFPVLPLQAQDQEQRWYQVEVLVVAHTSPAAQRAERWAPLPVLAYPDKVRFLLDPARLQANFSATPDALYSAVDARGLQSVHLRPVSTAAPGAASALPGSAAAAGNPQGEAPTPGVASAEVGALGDPATNTLLELPHKLPTPFMLLPAQSREFRGKAAYMERNGPYRVLFHEVWWQPVGSERTALPIVLDQSGERQAYPPLQGTITLHRSRFLHVDTQLWLNTDGNYLPGSWRMPAPPLAPASLEIVAAPTAAPLPALAAALSLESQPDISLGDSLLEDAVPELVATPPPYPYRHAVLLQQQRRMRSNEVHYIDHPLLGMVIKLTPLDSETLQAADYDQGVLNLISGQAPPAGEAVRSGGA